MDHIVQPYTKGLAESLSNVNKQTHLHARNPRKEPGRASARRMNGILSSKKIKQDVKTGKIGEDKIIFKI